MISEAQPAANAVRNIRWVRVVVGALLAEVVLFAIAIAFYLVPNGSTALLYIVPPACLAATMFFGFRVARTAGSRFIVHGTLVGCVAALIYIVLTWGRVLPMAYVVSHFLKVLGGFLGGWLAQRRHGMARFHVSRPGK